MCLQTDEHVPRILVQSDDGLVPLAAPVDKPVRLHRGGKVEVAINNVDFLAGQENFRVDLRDIRAVEEVGLVTADRNTVDHIGGYVYQAGGWKLGKYSFTYLDVW